MLRKLWGSRRGFTPRFGPNEGADSCEALAKRYRERTSPRFFFEPSDLSRRIERIAAERPIWRQRVLDQVASYRESLPIYGRPGPPLGAGYPWGELDAGPGRDKLYRKRPHRFAFLPRIALAELYGAHGAGYLEEIVRDWMRYASSRENALAYDSNLTVIQRSLAITWAWAFLSACDGDELSVEGLLLTVLAEDLRFLEPRLGKSFANNHLLADRFAGWFFRAMFPELIRPRNESESEWLAELSRQILPDGTSFEHSTHYHEYACEMTSLYLLFSRRNDRDVPAWVEERLARMLKFQVDLGGTDAFPTVIGDAAEDPLLPLDGGDGWAPAAWRELYRSLRPGELVEAPPEARSAERAFWLLGGELAAPTPTTPMPDTLHTYADGGYYVIEREPERVVFRTGPVAGRDVMAGHAHADLMSVVVTLCGTPVFVDPGTYTYRAGSTPEWRRYLMGPGAHNTVTFEGADPLGVHEKDFRNASIASHVDVAHAHDAPSLAWVEAELDGGPPYGGWRRGFVRLQDGCSILYDVLPETSERDVASTRFQCAPGTELTVEGTRSAITVGRETVTLVSAGAGRAATVLTGSRHPIGGWVSRTYGSLEPAPQLRFEVPDGRRFNAFAWARGHWDASVDASDAGAFTVEVEHDGLCDVLVVGHGGDVELDDGGRFSGELLWLRTRAGVLERLHWLNGTSFSSADGSVAIQCGAPQRWLDVSRADGALDVRHAETGPVSVDWPDPMVL